jgi:signal transduction histidine kinase
VKIPGGLQVSLSVAMSGIALLVSLLAIAAHTGLEVRGTVMRSAQRTRDAAQQAALVASRAGERENGNVHALRDDPALRALFESAQAGDPTLFDLAVTDPAGIIVAHSDTTRVGHVVEVRPTLESLESGDVMAETVRLLGAPRTYDEVIVLQAAGRPFGSVRVGVSTTLLRAQLIESLSAGLWVTALSIAIALIVALLWAQVLSARVRAVVAGLERFREGQFAYRLNVQGGDELSLLASSINALGERLEAARRRAAAGDTNTDELLAATGQLSAWAKVASGLAHEMADPLNATQLHLKHLKRKWKEPPEEAMRHLQVLEDELGRLDTIVQGFRRFAMLGEMQSQWFDLRALLEEIAERTRESAHRSRIEVRAETADAPRRFWGDPKLLRQALSNLMANAEQAMPGGGQVTVAAHKVRDAVDVCVADQGIGIPAELQNRVFDFYFTTKAEGSGIGLAIVRQVAQLHGGNVDLQSAPGQGTRITLHLPARAGALAGVA